MGCASLVKILKMGFGREREGAEGAEGAGEEGIG